MHAIDLAIVGVVWAMTFLRDTVAFPNKGRSSEILSFLDDEKKLKRITAVLFMLGAGVFWFCLYSQLPHIVCLVLSPIYLVKSFALAQEYCREPELIESANDDNAE